MLRKCTTIWVFDNADTHIGYVTRIHRKHSQKNGKPKLPLLLFPVSYSTIQVNDSKVRHGLV